MIGLANRFSLDQRLPRPSSRRDARTRQLAVMFIDLDRFWAINDTLGHPVGDHSCRGMSPSVCAPGAGQ
ncbi:MAG: diguanylate cyclase [Rhodocyclaceae bacterium]|nr:diguanylate cyclase [Rhodocyclaceae bacterium]